MFDNSDQRTDWKNLMAAIDEMPNPPACENYPDAFFPDRNLSPNNDDTRWAKQMCRECPVKLMCAEFGLKWEDHGIWGGLTQLDRRRLRSTGRFQRGTIYPVPSDPLAR